MNCALMFAEYQAIAVAPRRCGGMLPVTISAAIPIAVHSGCRMSSWPASSWTTSWVLSSWIRRPRRSWNHQPVSAASRPLPIAMMKDIANDWPPDRPMISSPAKIAGQTRLPHNSEAIIDRPAGI
jgi:hypothetical protein